MDRGRPRLIGFACWLVAGFVGAIVGAVAGVGIAGRLLRPEEAVVLVTGVTYGAPLGAVAGHVVAGLALVVCALVRRGGKRD
jgi:hypothetical protein